MKNKQAYDSIGTNFIFLNYRVFELSKGFQLNYMYMPNQSGLTGTAAMGYVNYSNETSIKNGLYEVDGGFAKIGAMFYQKLWGGAIYCGPNFIVSNSKQNLSAIFSDKVWGKYIEKYSIDDLNLGAELSIGILGRLSKSVFMNLEGSLGTKISNQDNPIANKIKYSTERDKEDIPYFSPGMGRGGVLFINFNIGFGIEF
jgi:hypothetical protein